MRQQAGIPARMHVTDQAGAEADLTGAQYAQVMAEYNAFQHRVKTSIVQVQSHVAQLPGGGQVEMRHSFGVNTVRVMVPKAMAPAIKGKTIIVDADFIVITYGFTEADGRDLDTRTKLVNPIQSGYIGWRRGNGIGVYGSVYGTGHENYSFDIEPYANELVATWGGDNQGYGAESVFIDIKKIKSIHRNSPISFECRAFWYDERLRGDCNFSVKVYKGGEIKFDEPNYKFLNVEGALVAELEKTQNVATQINDDVAGDLVAVVSFDPSTNQLTLA